VEEYGRRGRVVRPVPSPHPVRARLNDRLARAARFPIALVVAPAGFGKSTALRDFLQTSHLDAVRFDVRREEQTLHAFARRFSEVLDEIAPGIAAAFPAMQERMLSARDAPHLVCDWFAEHFKDANATIVVDDLHFAAADPGSIAFLAALVERTAERARWILAGRSDSDLPIASWLAYGRMDSPVDENDLRLTLDEALAAAGAAQPDVLPADIESLWDLTGGWPVALAIALRTRTQAADLRAAATREMIYRYLAEQVLAGVSPPQREFLLATSIFATFDVAIAKALHGTAEFIAELRRDVAFLTEIAPGRYRYHDLFRDFLESELQRRGREAWTAALSAGARLLEERGDVPGALALHTKAEDSSAILRVIESSGFALFERGQADALAAALEAVPEELRRRQPTALGLQAALDAARGYFEPARSGFVAAIERAEGDDLRLGLVHRYAIELVRQGRDCIALLEHHARDERVPPALRVPLLGTLATAYVRASRSAEALETIARALELLDPIAPDDIRARLYQQAAFVYSQLSLHDRAREYATLAVEIALARNLYDVAVRAYSVLYQVAYDDTDDPVLCLAILEKLLDCARKGGSVQGKLYGLLASYGIEADRGDEEALRRIDEQLEEIPGMLAQNRDEVLLPALALRATWQRDFRRAYDLLAQASEPQNDERGAEHFAGLALYAAAAGSGGEADAAVEKAADALAGWGRPTRRALRARLLLAFVELARGRNAAAHRQLLEVERELQPSMRRLGALAHAGRMLYRTAIGQAERELLEAAFERLRVEHFGGFAGLLRAVPFPEAPVGGFAALTATEREILQLLATGASTKDVAERTARSPLTVDTHIRSICKKLNCRGRRAAVALATGAGWVQNEVR
jgi:DNA-binding CsgD family transcriptional regulator